MWRNYVTVGVRALAKSRTYAIINIAGLAIGLAACLMLLVYVHYERSYDEWLPNSENIYQVQSSFRNPDTGESTDFQMSAYPAGPALKQDFSQIAGQVYLGSARPVVLRNGEAIEIPHAVVADNKFFDVLPLQPYKGNFARLVKAPSLPGWVHAIATQGAGAAGPAKTVAVAGAAYRLDRVCKVGAACATDRLDVLWAPRGGRVWGALVEDGRPPVMLGDPKGPQAEALAATSAEVPAAK